MNLHPLYTVIFIVTLYSYIYSYSYFCDHNLSNFILKTVQHCVTGHSLRVFLKTGENLIIP